ncbi:MAG: Tim44/TimA family putative adaptor protein [Elsteraceae bacterium]
MGDGFPIIDVLLFGLVAAFLFYRLRSVLGQRTGHERQRPNPFAAPESPAETGAPRDNVITLPERQDATKAPGVAAPGVGVLPLGLAAIKRVDPAFNEEEFLGGARAAFEMIVDAFSHGDAPALRPLLAPDVMRQFEGVIEQRRARGETMETTLHSVKAIAIAEARLDGTNAIVTVKYVTEQTNVVRDRDGAIIDGDPKVIETATDLWSFARDVRATDPNWLLVATRTDG